MFLALVGPISVALKIKLGFGPEIPKKKKKKKNQRKRTKECPCVPCFVHEHVDNVGRVVS